MTPRLWFRFDVGFLNEPPVRKLRRVTGADGVSAFVAMLCDAYERYYLGERQNGGLVDMSLADLARLAGFPADRAPFIVRAIATVGLVEIEHEDETDFRARLT